MKDVKGTHVAAIRNAIFKTFGLQTTTIRQKNSQDILGWKKSKKVKESYEKSFTNRNIIENIVTKAFPYLNTASEDVFSDMYIYTTAVCDIILNPDNPTIEILKKSLELRMRRFKVFVEFTFYFKNY